MTWHLTVSQDEYHRIAEEAERQPAYGRTCPDCGTAYAGRADDEGILDCPGCGLWTLPILWTVRSDLDYATL